MIKNNSAQATDDSTNQPAKKPRLDEKNSQWQCLKTAMDELKEINEANKERYEEVEVENYELRTKLDAMTASKLQIEEAYSDLQLELEAVKASKSQPNCNDCGKAVEMIVYCNKKCHESCIQKRLQLTADLEE